MESRESRGPERAWAKVEAAAFVLSLLPILGGLTMSATLTVDYLRPHPFFCAEGGGCDAIRRTALARPGGIPMPILGLVGFLLLGAAVLWPGARARSASRVLALGAGGLGAALLLVQVRLGRMCPYCVVADTCGILSALAAVLRHRLAVRAPPSWVSIAAAGLGLGAVVVPPALALRGRPLPVFVRDTLAATPRGEVTIIDFVDFECPFCRANHRLLEPLVRSHLDRIRLVRLQVPLHIHPHSLDAARAACCAERQGKAEAMADALFAAPVDQLTRGGCEHIAETVGLSLDAFRACVADPSTTARIEQDRATFKSTGGHALPTVWIDRRELVGAQSREALDAALAQAIAKTGS